MVVLFLSQGTPMLLMGDEIGQSHFGNNNAYCQDQPWNWFPWKDWKKQEHLFLFVQTLIALRKSLPFLQSKTFMREKELHIYNESLLPDHAGSERFASFQIFDTLFYAFNANNFSLTIQLPSCKESHTWKLLIYTTNPIEESIYPLSAAPPRANPITLAPYTCLVMIQSL